jgi:hypothetical protein
MIALGTTLRCNLPPRHLWVVISDPQQTGDAILLVSLTTLREGCVDDVCILNAPDFPGYLTHATTAAYSRAKAGSAAGLTESIAEGSFTVVTPIPLTTLARIIDGARNSDELSASSKKLLPI